LMIAGLIVLAAGNALVVDRPTIGLLAATSAAAAQAVPALVAPVAIWAAEARVTVGPGQRSE
jgi:hypothetical protein